MIIIPVRVFSFYVLILATICAAVAIVLARILSRRRTRAMEAAAGEIGFRFEGADWADIMQTPDLGSALFGEGGGRWSNIMTGSACGLKTSLFDYSCSFPYSQRGSYQQTVAVFSLGVQLPIFEVCPDNVSDPLRRVRSYPHMDFDFSERYILRGPDRERILDLFNPALTSTLISLTPEDHWHIEGSGTTLVLYRIGITVPAKELPAFLQQTSVIARAFLDLCGLNKPVASPPQSIDDA